MIYGSTEEPLSQANQRIMFDEANGARGLQEDCDGGLRFVSEVAAGAPCGGCG